MTFIALFTVEHYTYGNSILCAVILEQRDETDDCFLLELSVQRYLSLFLKSILRHLCIYKVASQNNNAYR